MFSGSTDKSYWYSDRADYFVFVAGHNLRFICRYFLIVSRHYTTYIFQFLFNLFVMTECSINKFFKDSITIKDRTYICCDALCFIFLFIRIICLYYIWLNKITESIIILLLVLVLINQFIIHKISFNTDIFITFSVIT